MGIWVLSPLVYNIVMYTKSHIPCRVIYWEWLVEWHQLSFHLDGKDPLTILHLDLSAKQNSQIIVSDRIFPSYLQFFKIETGLQLNIMQTPNLLHFFLSQAQYTGNNMQYLLALCIGRMEIADEQVLDKCPVIVVTFNI